MRRRSDGGGDGGGAAGSQRAKTKTPHKDVGNVVTISGSGPTSYSGNGLVVIALMRVFSLAVPTGMVDVICTPLDIMDHRKLRCLNSIPLMIARLSSSVGGRNSRTISWTCSVPSCDASVYSATRDVSSKRSSPRKSITEKYLVIANSWQICNRSSHTLRSLTYEYAEEYTRSPVVAKLT